VAGVNNHPGAHYGGVAWLGPDESFWLFGGAGYPHNNDVGSLNDLWRFVADSSCVYCKALFLPETALGSSEDGKIVSWERKSLLPNDRYVEYQVNN
jgi:hypothetical protein